MGALCRDGLRQRIQTRQQERIPSLYHDNCAVISVRIQQAGWTKVSALGYVYPASSCSLFPPQGGKANSRNQETSLLLNTAYLFSQTFSRLEHRLQRFGRVLIVGAGAVAIAHSLSAHVVGIRLDVGRRLYVILATQGLHRIMKDRKTRS